MHTVNQNEVRLEKLARVMQENAWRNVGIKRRN